MHVQTTHIVGKMFGNRCIRYMYRLKEDGGRSWGEPQETEEYSLEEHPEEKEKEKADPFSVHSVLLITT